MFSIAGIVNENIRKVFKVYIFLTGFQTALVAQVAAHMVHNARCDENQQLAAFF